MIIGKATKSGRPVKNPAYGGIFFSAQSPPWDAHQR
jgi:hypothetical protein